MKLYTYYQSSAAYRVRIAMNLKGIDYLSEGIDLLGSVQTSEHYLQANPQGLVPALLLDDGTLIGQSTAILEYLEETHTQHPLLPTDSVQRSQVRSLVNHIACDVHPLNNLRVRCYLRDMLDADKAQEDRWYAHWIHTGFVAIEKTLAQGNGRFCFGDTPGMADCYLIPQVFNALRTKIDIDRYTAILAIYNHCTTLAAFQSAHPSQQPDKPAS